MQELKSHRVVMTAIMEEMKYFREREQTRLEDASKPERQFSNELGKQHSNNLWGAGEFHCSPKQAEIRYLPLHRREGGILENVARQKPNLARTTAP